MGGRMAADSVVSMPDHTPLDELLDDVSLTLQISSDQFGEAERRYHQVGKWLSAPGSKLARFRSQIYAQGSMRLKTTVRPRGSRGEEYDLDIVFEVDDVGIGAMELYALVLDRLREHPDYRDRIEPLKRCVRLNYSGFHLDILPARRDPTRTDGCIEVPDRELRDWHPSNPNGYAMWFEQRCARAREVLLKARAATQQPLPETEPADLLVSLRRAVQLMKRHRDNRFDDDDRAPRSIVLTTLAGDTYAGAQSTSDVLDATLATIDAATAEAEAGGGRLVVLNPSHPEEDFSERWETEQAEYRLFKDFIRQFRLGMAALRAAEGLDEQARILNEMFGRGLGSRALDAYMKKVRVAAQTRELRSKGPTMLVGATDGQRPARHTFHHGA